MFRRGGYIIIPNSVVCFIPYYGDSRWLEEFRELEAKVNDLRIEGDIDESYGKILITHMGFDGVKNNDGSEVESEITEKI